MDTPKHSTAAKLFFDRELPGRFELVINDFKEKTIRGSLAIITALCVSD